MTKKRINRLSYMFTANDFDIKRYGLEAAVMKYELTIFCRKKNLMDFYKSFSLTESDLKFMFPYWSEEHAKHVLQKLIDEKVMFSKPGKRRGQRLFTFATKECLA